MSKSVVVLGEKIPVKVVTQAKMNEILPNYHAMGIWASDLKTIFLSKELNKEEALYTMCHEIGHVLFTKTGIDQVLAPELQEIIVQSYATVIVDIIKKRTKLTWAE
jgi:Zn-dependent peptidase ImmA (M78 family)